MAVSNFSEQFNNLQKIHGKAFQSAKRSRQVIRALRSLTESRLEKNLVNAGYESLDNVINEMSILGSQLREMVHAIRLAEQSQQEFVQQQ